MMHFSLRSLGRLRARRDVKYGDMHVWGQGLSAIVQSRSPCAPVAGR
jgi:hypothetical protein